jgi:hypothetical protein
MLKDKGIEFKKNSDVFSKYGEKAMDHCVLLVFDL